MKKTLHWLRPDSLLSIRGLLVRALWMGLAFAVVAAAGLREHTTFLSGTPISTSSGDSAVVGGVIYLVVYFGFILVVPIFLLAAAFLALGKGWIAQPAAVRALSPALEDKESAGEASPTVPR